MPSPLKTFLAISRLARGFPRRGRWPALFLVTLGLPFLVLSDPEPRIAEAVKPAPTEGPAPAFDPLRLSGPLAPSAADLERQGWSWDRAKRLAAYAWDGVAADRPEGLTGFYCGCRIERRGSSGGDVDFSACGYVPRKSESRASRLEWEHVMPAAVIGAGRSCWTQGDPQCVRDGRAFKGRSCCELVDPVFKMAASDPVNLVPSVGEVNGDRSDFFFDIIEGEERLYGQCDVEVDWERDVMEPPADRRGDVARIWAYMSRAYGIRIDAAYARTYAEWNAQDPVSRQEIEVNEQIRALGHRANPFVLP